MGIGWGSGITLVYPELHPAGTVSAQGSSWAIHHSIAGTLVVSLVRYDGGTGKWTLEIGSVMGYGHARRSCLSGYEAYLVLLARQA